MDHLFVLENLVSKDFRTRYRNMSLGVFWSLLNPLVMMAVLTFVFTIVLPSGTRNFPVSVLCGLVPFNFFSMGWSVGTLSILDGAGLVKRVPMRREIIPIAAVLSTGIHMSIQLGLLLAVTLFFGFPVNPFWLWIPLLWILIGGFICGLSLATSAVNVYVRDTRYAVESFNAVMFWLVPIFYSFEIIPEKYWPVYQYNPVAAVTLALRSILMNGVPPPGAIVSKLALVSLVTFICGWLVFRKLEGRFYDQV